MISKCQAMHFNIIKKVLVVFNIFVPMNTVEDSWAYDSEYFWLVVTRNLILAEKNISCKNQNNAIVAESSKSAADFGNWKLHGGDKLLISKLMVITQQSKLQKFGFVVHFGQKGNLWATRQKSEVAFVTQHEALLNNFTHKSNRVSINWKKEVCVCQITSHTYNNSPLCTSPTEDWVHGESQPSPGWRTWAFWNGGGSEKRSSFENAGAFVLYPNVFCLTRWNTQLILHPLMTKPQETFLWPYAFLYLHEFTAVK